MRIAISFVALLAVIASLPAEGGAMSRCKECKQACEATVDACVTAGGKRKRCKRQTLKQCRKEGVAVCGATTTTSPTGTTVPTTTIPPGTTAPCESTGAPACGGRCARRTEVCSNQGGTCACVGVPSETWDGHLARLRDSAARVMVQAPGEGRSGPGWSMSVSHTSE